MCVLARRGNVRKHENSLRRGALIPAAGLIALATFALPAQAAAGHQARAATLSRSSQPLAVRQVRTEAGAWRLVRAFSVRGRWNGSTWARAAVPPALSARFRGQEVGGLGASSSRNVWAFSVAGSYLRLTGNRWRFGRVPRRVMTRKDFIESTEVLSPTNVWVFGTHVIGSIYSLKFVPFAARFDGRSWHAVTIRGVGIMGPVSVISPASMWALTDAVLPAIPQVGYL
jgi:hypothetical protein